MSLDMLSFGLALLVGGLCFFLVKRTADEFDRWYDEPRPVISLRIPAAAISLIAVIAAIAVIAVH